MAQMKYSVLKTKLNNKNNLVLRPNLQITKWKKQCYWSEKLKIVKKSESTSFTIMINNKIFLNFLKKVKI